MSERNVNIMDNISETISTISNIVGCIRELSSMIKGSQITIKEIEELASISSDTNQIIESMKYVFSIENTYIEQERKLNRQTGIYVTTDGHFYDNEGKELHPVWYEGDMRLVVGENVKRCSVLITQTFGIKSDDLDGIRRIGYRDGDKRNLSVDNLYWYEGDEIDPKICLVEDVCRRLIECNGDVDETLKYYAGSTPRVSRQYIRDIKRKKGFKEISDGFFTFENGSIIPNIEIKSSNTNGLDCYGLLIQTKDTSLTEEMLKRKIEMSQNVSLFEEMIMWISIQIKDDENILTYDQLNKAIKEKFKYEPSQLNDVNRSKFISILENIKEIYVREVGTNE